MKKILVILTILCVMCGCASTSQSSNDLVVYTSSGYEPYEMVDSEGKLIGFDIDFGEELAKRMGKTIKWTDTSFDAVIAALATKNADMAIAGLSPDPKRQASFSETYYSPNESAFYVVTDRDNQIHETKDIQGKTVGVQIATIQENAVNLLADKYQLKIDSRDAYNVMVQEVLTKRIDFLVMEPAVAKSFLESYPELISFELQEPTLNQITGVSVGLPKDSKLIEEVNKQIEAMKQDGTLDRLKDKWFK